MKWYDYLILRFQEYRLYVFLPFIAIIIAGAVCIIAGASPKLPTLTFVGLLVAWAIVWIIASVLYRKNLKK
jgi:hypothetical protein